MIRAIALAIINGMPRFSAERTIGCGWHKQNNDRLRRLSFSLEAAAGDCALVSSHLKVSTPSDSAIQTCSKAGLVMPKGSFVPRAHRQAESRDL